MGQVIQFPQLRNSKVFGLYAQNELCAAEHLVRQRKAKYIPTHELPESMQRSRFGEVARRGLRVEGYAILEFENLCAYLLDLHA